MNTKFKNLVLWISCFLIIFVSSLFLLEKIKLTRLFSDNPKPLLLNEIDEGRQAGFDFTQYSNGESAGPPINSFIEIERMKSLTSTVFNKVITSDLVVIVTINKGCHRCWESRDLMSTVQQQLEKVGIAYCLIVVNSRNIENDLRYLESFKISNAKLFALPINYSPNVKPELLSLYEIVTPSHLLLDRRGKVLMKWPGASSDPLVRKNQAYQIISDTHKFLTLP